MEKQLPKAQSETLTVLIIVMSQLHWLFDLFLKCQESQNIANFPPTLHTFFWLLNFLTVKLLLEKN